MAINKETLELIKLEEGLRLNAYPDPVGVWTIGYGHTANAGPPAPKKGMKITAAEAERILLSDLKKFEGFVNQYVKVPLNENQYGALVSLCFNIGPGNFSKSTLLRKLNAKDYKGAAEQFLVWNKGTVKGKKVTLPGLVKRRKNERALFLKVTSKASPTPSPASPIASKPSVEQKNIFQLLGELLSKLFGGK